VIAAAAAAFIFREIEAWRSRKRELKGLLRLLAVEIAYNQKVLDLFIESPRAMEEMADEAGLLSRAWEENRARIAQLLNNGENFQRLANYFIYIAVVEKERLEVEKQRSLLLHLPSVLEQGEAAQRVVDEVVGAQVRRQVQVPALGPRNAG
jgi:hypothetical protein